MLHLHGYRRKEPHLCSLSGLRHAEGQCGEGSLHEGTSAGPKWWTDYLEQMEWVTLQQLYTEHIKTMSEWSSFSLTDTANQTCAPRPCCQWHLPFRAKGVERGGALLAPRLKSSWRPSARFQNFLTRQEAKQIARLRSPQECAAMLQVLEAAGLGQVWKRLRTRGGSHAWHVVRWSPSLTSDVI